MCEYCEWQRDADKERPIQDSGSAMLICNGDQLIVEDEDENVKSPTAKARGLLETISRNTR